MLKRVGTNVLMKTMETHWKEIMKTFQVQTESLKKTKTEIKTVNEKFRR